MTYHAIRSSKSGRIFSLLSLAELSGEGDGPNSTIYQTISATTSIGDYHRAMVFVTENFEVAASLFLFGFATDFKETLHLSRFLSPGKIVDLSNADGEGIELVDIVTGLAVAVSMDDPRLVDLIEVMASIAKRE